MSSPATLIWNVIFGAIGLGFFVYGKRQKTVVPLLCGVGLMGFPYFISNSYLLVATGIVLTALPFLFRI